MSPCSPQALLGIARSLFLVLLLTLSSQLIHSDTRRLVLEPVERMIQRVKEMTDNPLAGVMQQQHHRFTKAFEEGSAQRSSMSGAQGAVMEADAAVVLTRGAGGGADSRAGSVVSARDDDGASESKALLGRGGQLGPLTGGSGPC
jgi:hypothetical protein